MLALFFVAAGLCHLLLLLLTLRLRSDAVVWIVRALLLGLIADNTILAISNTSMDEGWYFGASWLRYAAHVILLPPLAFAALVLAARSGLGWADTNVARWLCLSFVIVGIWVGMVTEMAGLELVRESLLGHERFVSADAMPPVATIATNLVVLFLSAQVWRRAKWPWLFAAALLILLANGASAGKAWGIISGNLAEVVFLSGWVASLYRFPKDGIRHGLEE